MGVKYLWDVIDETKSKETLDALHGKVLSVDLSIWIVEAIKTLQFKKSVKKPYLRNLFFRILCLRRLGVKLVFVTEGEPPDLKQQTMKQRLKQSYFVETNSNRKWGRSRFQRIINECCCLLEMLGLPCMKAAGEAEAMCAMLNKHKLTDGCLTNDGDFFLYGGEVIYRDFGIDPKDPHVLIYTADKIQKRLGISRQDMIGLSLLCGCDYTKGVAGVGKILVSRFLKERNFNENLLGRFAKWNDVDFFSLNGITQSEIHIARKAIKELNFINQKIIDEFLIDKDSVEGLHGKFEWRYPNIKGVQEFLLAKLEWPFDYTLDKILQLCSCTYLEKLSQSSTEAPILPTRILKTRCQGGTALLEIEWTKNQHSVGDEKWREIPPTFTTLENQQIVCKVLPDVIEKFMAEKKERRKGEKTKKKKKDKLGECTVDELCKQFRQINTSPLADESVEMDVNILRVEQSTYTDVKEHSTAADESDISLNSEDNILPLSQRLLLNMTNRRIASDEPTSANLDLKKKNIMNECIKLSQVNEDSVTSSKTVQVSPTREIHERFCQSTPKCLNLSTPEATKSGLMTDAKNSSPSIVILGDSLLCDSLEDISVLL